MLFISYSNLDAGQAGLVKQQLEAKGYSCFLAHDDIKAFSDWHNDIWTALRNSSAFIGLVTDNFIASPFCQQEVGAAFALNKPTLLVLINGGAPPGFSARFQAIRLKDLFETIATHPSFRSLRVDAWIRGVREAGSYNGANAVHEQFKSEWNEMSPEEKLRWLLAAASNSQVSGEGYKVGTFFRAKKNELKPLLTDQWLFDNDKAGVLHDFDENPITKNMKPNPP